MAGNRLLFGNVASDSTAFRVIDSVGARVPWPAALRGRAGAGVEARGAPAAQGQAGWSRADGARPGRDADDVFLREGGSEAELQGRLWSLLCYLDAAVRAVRGGLV